MKNMRKVIGFLVSTVFLVIVGGACGGGAAGKYIIGGTVTGLTGTLVMQCNGADDLTVTADGAFAFATALADKTAYTVTVLTQPATQTCTVVNGTGTLGGADVTDVTVTCSVNAYTVGGTVTGLSGTLILQNNGADDLTVTADGAFTFATAVAGGSGYAVTVSSRPIVQNCPVTNGSGTMSGANVTDVTVDCSNKAWKHPSDLTDSISPPGYDAYDVRVAMKGEVGNAVIVWHQDNGTTDQIFMSEFLNGVWTHPADETDDISPGDTYAEYPEVAMDESGDALIVWNQDDGTGTYRIYMSEYRNGSWTHPSGLSDYISPDTPVDSGGFYPQVAMDDNGNAIIVWEQPDGANSQIFMSEYRNGSWTHPADTNTNISTDGFGAYEPRVAMDNNGNAIIVWHQSDGANAQLFKSEYRNGSWTYPADENDNISPDGQNVSSYYEVAMGDNGNAIIVWRQRDGTYDRIYRSEYRGGSWTHPLNINDNLGFGNYHAYLPDVAMDANGDTILIWKQSDGSDYQLYKSEYRNGSWTPPADINDYISFSGSPLGYPYVAMDDNGQAIIAWDQDHPTDGYGYVYKSEYRGGSWTHPTSIDDYISPAGDNCSMMDIAMDPNGDAIIVWDQYDGAGIGQIFMSEFR